MSNIFTRMKETVASDLHGMMDKKDEKNPISALNHYLRQSEQETEKVRVLVERQHRLKEEFSRERLLAEEMAEKRKRQLEIAKEAGESELTQFVQHEYEEYSERAERLTLSQIEAMKQLEALEKKYEEMMHKLKDMRIKRMELMGRENVAKARHQMSRITEETVEEPYSKFGEMERYIEGLEHKLNRDYYHHTIDSKIAALEKNRNFQQNNTVLEEK
ncbi:modulator protein [Salipaludibacillus neizhouensis]|uniref:Modulator protein n=1 Tax=Salipaludibacillus neizhouensis TaxID=885475 RepID=A0A3A9K8G6_9BACI|nr:PspA/IM30 family protein [Salipaludibacillus neizhouensis]RKL65933.1 modulator protein [Salipaludibacillus neizhouensis]